MKNFFRILDKKNTKLKKVFVNSGDIQTNSIEIKKKLAMAVFIQNIHHSFNYYYNEYNDYSFHNIDMLDDGYYMNIYTIFNPDFKYSIYDYDMSTLASISDELVKFKLMAVEKRVIDVRINSLSDLIKVCDDNDLVSNIEYNIDLSKLYEIKPELIELNNMIGLECLKDSIVDQLLYYLQKLHTNGKGDFLHTVIYGSPGTGKTEIAVILGSIFSKLGILKSDKFKKVTRSDLIGGYLGQTALKTNDLIKSSLGGVLFIDEAYSLGNSEKRDSFAKECIDTLCEALSYYKNDLMVIIAGYKDELKECFFDYNQGLNSRFTWRYTTGEYNAQNMMDIFQKKVLEEKWVIEPGCITEKWFDTKMQYFNYYGRDMETLFAKIKVAHGRRIFGKNINMQKILNIDDMTLGFKKYLENDEVKDRKHIRDKDKALFSLLYN